MYCSFCDRLLYELKSAYGRNNNCLVRNQLDTQLLYPPEHPRWEKLLKTPLCALGMWGLDQTLHRSLIWVIIWHVGAKSHRPCPPWDLRCNPAAVLCLDVSLGAKHSLHLKTSGTPPTWAPLRWTSLTETKWLPILLGERTEAGRSRGPAFFWEQLWISLHRLGVTVSDGESQHKESLLSFWKDKSPKTPHEGPENFSW